MTCEKCYHNDVCKALYELNGIPRIGATDCAYFRDKDRLIDLPCAVGDAVYMVMSESSFFDNCTFVVTGFEINSGGNCTYRAVCEKDDRLIPLHFGEQNLGKNVFLTREAAEAARIALERSKRGYGSQ